MPLVDLGTAVRDTTKSCVFDYPDRPIRPTPPVYTEPPSDPYPFEPWTFWGGPPAPSGPIIGVPNPPGNPPFNTYSEIEFFSFSTSGIGSPPYSLRFPTTVDLREVLPSLDTGEPAEIESLGVNSMKLDAIALFQAWMLDPIHTGWAGSVNSYESFYVFCSVHSNGTHRLLHFMWAVTMVPLYSFYFPIAHFELDASSSDTDVTIEPRTIAISDNWQASGFRPINPQVPYGDTVDTLCVHLPHYSRNVKLKVGDSL